MFCLKYLFIYILYPDLVQSTKYIKQKDKSPQTRRTITP